MTLDAREVIRRIRSGQSNRQVARELGLHRKTVGRYRRIAREEGLLEGPLPTVEALEKRLQEREPPFSLPETPFKAAPHRAVIEKLRERGVELAAIHQRLRNDHGYEGSYSALRRYVIHLEGRTPEAFVRLEVGPGKEAQVDFGSAGEQVEPGTGELKKAWVFVMTLSHSRHQYATVVFDQKVSTWIRCHREAFEYFGGVPEKIVIDNLRAAIVKAVLHDPVAQRSYRELAEHYGFLISPCRPYTPRHKGKVESGVRYVKRSFLAGRSPDRIDRVNAELLDWIERVAGTRVHGTTKLRPRARFLEVERAALLSLPRTPYDLGYWKKAKLHPDCHVVLDGAYYSAPHRLIGQQLWVRTNGRDVHLFHDYERVATHAWGPPGTRRTNPAHYPPDKVMFLMKTPAYCRKRAEEIGTATARVIERLFAERPLDRLRTVQAILRLSDKYGPARLEAACRRGLVFDDTSYVTLKRILEHGLETDPLPDVPTAACEQRSFAFARSGSEIFSQKRRHGSWT